MITSNNRINNETYHYSTACQCHLTELRCDGCWSIVVEEKPILIGRNSGHTNTRSARGIIGKSAPIWHESERLLSIWVVHNIYCLCCRHFLLRRWSVAAMIAIKDCKTSFRLSGSTQIFFSKKILLPGLCGGF
jgi:hypothetical protein